MLENTDIVSINYMFGPENTTPKNFEKGVSTLKMHEMFSVQTTTEKFKNTPITGHFGFVLRKTQTIKEITLLS